MTRLTRFLAIAASASATYVASAQSNTYVQGVTDFFNTGYSGGGIDLSVYFAQAYANGDPFAYGDTTDWTFEYFDNASYNSSAGFSSATGVPGSAFDQNYEYGDLEFKLTNNNSVGEWAVLSLWDAVSTQSWSDSNGYGFSYAQTLFENLSNGDYFSAYASSFSGYNEPSWTDLQWAYAYQGNSGSQNTLTYYGVNSSQGAFYYWGLDYEVYLQPGQTDYLVNTEQTYHLAYSAFPAPAAFLPFALGVLCRRRRNSAT